MASGLSLLASGKNGHRLQASGKEMASGLVLLAAGKKKEYLQIDSSSN
jgi:hypothetical protein